MTIVVEPPACEEAGNGIPRANVDEDFKMSTATDERGGTVFARPVDLIRRAAASAILLAARATGRQVGIVLVYHGLGAVDGETARELVPAVGTASFDVQLRLLSTRYRPVPPEQIREAAAARKRWGPFPVAVTFDDDLSSHLELAAPALARHGMAATFFLCGASLERPAPFWWERVQHLADAGRLDEAERALPEPRSGGLHALAKVVEELPAPERDAFASRLAALEDAAPPDGGLRAGAVSALVAKGFSIGFHTRRHDRLPPLDDAALAAALSDGRAELEGAAGGPIASISYPHGRADERVAAAAKEAGFSVGFTGTQRAVTPESDPLLLSRVSPALGGKGAFALRLARLALSG
jgi:peptidoglycan/xylan/chitin deacetylase (PgdA/CDA1 family)